MKRRIWALFFIIFIVTAALLPYLPPAQASPDPGGELLPVVWGNMTGWNADCGPALWWMGGGNRYGLIWVDGGKQTWGQPWLIYGYCSSGYGDPNT